MAAIFCVDQVDEGGWLRVAGSNVPWMSDVHLSFKYLLFTEQKRG